MTVTITRLYSDYAGASRAVSALDRRREFRQETSALSPATPTNGTPTPSPLDQTK
jgi:hypothetical protein